MLGPGASPASGAGTPATVEELPLSERLKPTTELHKELLARLNARQRLSERHIKDRYDEWDRVDEHVRLFVNLARKARKSDRTEDITKREVPFERAIVIPVSLAILLVRLTQLMAIFGSREPILQYEGRGPEDVRPAKLMETVVAYDLRQMTAILTLYAMCQDAEKYGIGVVYDTWETEEGWQITPAPPVPSALQALLQRAPSLRPLVERMLAGLGFPLQPGRKWGPLREGNRWAPVDPFHFWPDPRVPVSQLQQGEFIGHRVFRGMMHLKERSQEAGSGEYFNLDELGRRGASADRRATSRNRFAQEQFSLREAPDGDDKGFYGIDHLQVKLLPRAWKLGAGDRPEIWRFAVADEGVIIRAHQESYAHGQFTYAVAESLPDEHALFNPGMIENLDGLQRTITWLINSHVDNVRKFLNDAVIYAPSLIEEADLLNPGPARHIRLTAKAEQLLLEGKLLPAQLIYQLPFNDVTKQHLGTANALFDMAQRLAAISDPQMSQTTDDKRTLGEVRQIVASSSQRLAVLARLIDAQALQPLAQRAVSNRQQFTSLEQYVRISGDLAREMGGAERIVVRSADLAGNFDYVPHSGVLPPDPSTFAEVWVHILEGVAKFPQLAQPGPDGKVLDVREIFNEAVRTAGVKNIESFYRDLRVVPDAGVAAAVQAGNMIPTAEAPVDGHVPGAGIQTSVVPVGVDLRGGDAGR